jgi:hypothetical protein
MFWFSQPVRWHQFPRKGKIVNLEWNSKCSFDVKTFVYEEEDVDALKHFWLQKKPLETPFFETTTISFLLPLRSMIVSRPVVAVVQGDKINAYVNEFWHGTEVVATHHFRTGIVSFFVVEDPLPFSRLTDFAVEWIRTDSYPDYKEPCVKANASHARDLASMLTKRNMIAPELPILIKYMELKRYSVFFTKGAMFVLKYANELMVDLVASVITDKVRAQRAFSTLMHSSTFRIVRVRCCSDSKHLLVPSYKTSHLYLHAFNYFPPYVEADNFLFV